MKSIITFIALAGFALAQTFAQEQVQNTDVKGFIYDQESGERISSVTIILEGVRTVYSDAEGFYALTSIKAGSYTIKVYYPFYDTFTEVIDVKGEVLKKDIYLVKRIANTGVAEIVAKKDKTKNVDISTQEITSRDIYRMPAVGGEADLVQYLQVLPGVVFTGDQGGQLYIRGGSPIMNKVMLDGLTIYNPFHSIGMFSVFETDLIKTADVYSAGFSSEYGGRISAVVDVKTRDGNRQQLRGKVSVNSITSKMLLEGPLKKFKKGEGNSSFSVSYKNSYLRQSSKLLYSYANPERLPYNFGDLYGKLSFNSANGGYVKLFGFYFSDNVDFPQSTLYNWNSLGFGGKFLAVPEKSKTKVDGYFSYSNYRIEQTESDQRPRYSGIGGFNLGMNFSYVIKTDELKWGLELTGFQTDFILYNSNNRKIDQIESTTEINSFVNYRFIRKNWVANIGGRAQYYASLGNRSLEPRLQFKWMPFYGFSLKLAAGKYSQNLLSGVSDRDVVNLFYGFLSGPDNLPQTFDGRAVTHKLQKANHLVIGTEWDFKRHHTITVEGFLKDFTQISNINRDKLFDDNAANQSKPERLRQDYIIETGQAYGGDFSYKYSHKSIYIWAVYSLTWVNRYDGLITYQPNFDRRHNINLLFSYTLDKENPTEISLRWNFGSGFPFTQTLGFYEKFDFSNGIGTSYTNGNGDLGVIYDGVNKGRLPYYHRLDFSAKRNWKLENKREFSLQFSITNVYNRNNIFYYDRVSRTRVDQLPILPALGASYSF